jgi:hypothetical protein
MRVDLYRLYRRARDVNAQETDRVVADFIHLRISTWEYVDRLNKIIDARQKSV